MLGKTLLLSAALLFAPIIYATHFADVSIPQRVKMSNFIVVGTIAEIDCVDINNNSIPSGKSCTGPGSPNRLKQKITVKEVLYSSPSIFQDKNSKLPEVVEYAETQMGHTSVPEDHYASSVGKEFIFFFRQDRGGQILPIHEAYSTAQLKDLKKVKKLIAKQQKS